MKVHECDQGSLPWMQLRVGLPTASQYDRLLTPKTRKPSASRKRYRAELLAEWLLGQPLEWGTSSWMERGTELEADARNYYALTHDVEVEQVGVVTRDDGATGGSPDGLIGDDGILEIKCPAALTHVLYMLGDRPKHTGQVQGLMYLTDRSWADVISYNPELPAVVHRVERDEEYIEALVAVLDPFIVELTQDKIRFAGDKVVRPWDMEAVA